MKLNVCVTWKERPWVLPVPNNIENQFYPSWNDFIELLHVSVSLSFSNFTSELIGAFLKSWGKPFSFTECCLENRIPSSIGEYKSRPLLESCQVLSMAKTVHGTVNSQFSKVC